MTQNSKTRKVAQPKPDSKKADEAPEADKAPEASTKQVEEAAPLDPPADEAPADEAKPDEAPADEAKPDEAPADEAAPVDDPESETNEADTQRAKGADPDGKAPRTAELDPPAERESDDDDDAGVHTLADAAAERATSTKKATITGEGGADVDTENLFGPVLADGKRQVNQTLLQNSVIDPFGRTITTLLLAATQRVSAANADLIVKKIEDERA